VLIVFDHLTPRTSPLRVFLESLENLPHLNLRLVLKSVPVAGSVRVVRLTLPRKGGFCCVLQRTRGSVPRHGASASGRREPTRLRLLAPRFTLRPRGLLAHALWKHAATRRMVFAVPVNFPVLLANRRPTLARVGVRGCGRRHSTPRHFAHRVARYFDVNNFCHGRLPSIGGGPRDRPARPHARRDRPTLR